MCKVHQGEAVDVHPKACRPCSMLCSSTRLTALQLNMVELTIGSKSLAEAFNEYMRESAEDYGGPQTDVGSAKSVMKKLTTQYMGCPALVLCDEYQVRTEVSLEASVEQHGCLDAVALQALENDLTHWLSQEEREMDPNPKLQALRVTYKLWNCLTPLIRDVPHICVCLWPQPQPSSYWQADAP